MNDPADSVRTETGAPDSKYGAGSKRGPDSERSSDATLDRPIPHRRIAAYALILNNQRVLLSKLNHGPAQGKWNLVGGGIQHGEDPVSAVLREIKEESGLTVKASDASLLTVLSERVVHTVRNSRHAPERNGRLEDFHLIGIIYLVRLEGNPKCKTEGDGDSSDGCRWFPLDEIPRDRPGAEKAEQTGAEQSETEHGERFVTFVAQALASLNGAT